MGVVSCRGLLVEQRWQAASLIQFAGTSHFHVLTEVFGRLLLLRDARVLQDPATRLVIPKPSGFLAAGLKMLTAGLGIAEDRMIHWTRGPSDVLLRAEKLYFADWQAGVQADTINAFLTLRYSLDVWLGQSVFLGWFFLKCLGILWKLWNVLESIPSKNKHKICCLGFLWNLLECFLFFFGTGSGRGKTG